MFIMKAIVRFLITIIVIAIIASALSVDESESVTRKWNQFKGTFYKTYSSENEERYRMKIFKENLEKFRMHNDRYKKKEVSYAMGINQFADMSPEECSNIITMTPRKVSRKEDTLRIRDIPPYNVTIPYKMSWREKDAVTPVKNQGFCKSAWAISANGALETQLKIHNRNLTELSEQCLIDCCHKNHGCCGGSVDMAFEFIKTNGGIDDRSKYPYEEMRRNCRHSSKNSRVTITEYKQLPVDEDVLKIAVANLGTVPTGFHVNAETFCHYSHGVYHDTNCASDVINHFMLITGYDETNAGEPFWEVKNSLGTKWGIDGYMKVKLGNNTCGIASDGYYPRIAPK